MDMEHILYAQVVKISQKYLESIAANKNKNEAKFKFQGQSARSQHWFDIDFDWIEVSFSTLEPDFFNIFFQRHDNTQYINSFKILELEIF